MPFPVFGAGAVQTAYVSFLALDISDKNITLVWPTSYVDAPNEDGTVNVLAASMTVNTDLGNTNTVTLPDATQTTVGANFIITNVGVSPFNLLKSDESLLINIPSINSSGTSNRMIAGEVTINTPHVQANSIIQLTLGALGTAHGQWRVSAIVPGVSFTVKSNNATETSTVMWAIMPDNWVSGTSAALTADTTVVSAPSVTANSKILLTNKTFGGTPGVLSAPAITPGIGFTITSSSGTDTSTVNWTIVQQIPDLTQGTATLVGGGATVATTAVTSNSIILLSYNTPNNPGTYIRVSEITSGTSFVITSQSAGDVSTINWAIFSSPTPYNSQANSYWVQLIDNSTEEGTWQLIQFGAGTSAGFPSVLAGNGLTAIGSTLNTNIPVQIKDNSDPPYTVSANDRANLIVWTGGAGTITLPAIADAPAGFYVSFNNEGTGTLTIMGMGNSNIDTAASIPISFKQSLSIISDGINWWTLGFGQNTSPTTFPDGTENAPSIKFNGATTTGFYCNTAPLYLGFSVSSAKVASMHATGIQVTSGSALNPSFSFLSDPDTGLYYTSNSTGVGFSVSATPIARVDTNGINTFGGKSINIAAIGNAVSTELSTTATYSNIQWIGSGGVTANLRLTGANGTTPNATLTLVKGNNLSLSSLTTSATISYNSIAAISISNTGFVTFPTAHLSFTATGAPPEVVSIRYNDTIHDNIAINIFSTGAITLSSALPIGSGGTGSTTAGAAINNLIPGGAKNDLAYHNGTTWIPFPKGGPDQFLGMTEDGDIAWMELP